MFPMMGAQLTHHVMQFYEEAWAGKLELVPGLMAESHSQRDMVWQVLFFLL